MWRAVWGVLWPVDGEGAQDMWRLEWGAGLECLQGLMEKTRLCAGGGRKVLERPGMWERLRGSTEI